MSWAVRAWPSRVPMIARTCRHAVERRDAVVIGRTQRFPQRGRAACAAAMADEMIKKLVSPLAPNLLQITGISHIFRLCGRWWCRSRGWPDTHRAQIGQPAVCGRSVKPERRMLAVVDRLVEQLSDVIVVKTVDDTAPDSSTDHETEVA